MPRSILVVDDETTLAKNITNYLLRHGYDARAVPTGYEAIEALDTFKPDLLLLDFNLPGMSGLDVLHQVDARDEQIKVILMTGHGSVQVAVDAMKGGAYDYLTKPVVLAELKLLVDKAIGQDHLPLPAGAQVVTPEDSVSAATNTNRDQAMNLERAEKNLLIQALTRTRWNVTQAAKLLGISRDTLRYRMAKNNVRRPEHL